MTWWETWTWNFLAPGTSFAWYWHREKEFVEFFNMKDSLAFCSSVEGLVNQMGKQYDSTERRLFIDSSNRSLQGVLLHNWNELASLSEVHSVQMKETYDNVKTLLNELKYDQHQWLICGEGHCTFACTTRRLHKIPVFPMSVGSIR